MAEGTYQDRNGVTVTVKRTRSGYMITYPNGRTVVV